MIFARGMSRWAALTVLALCTFTNVRAQDDVTEPTVEVQSDRSITFGTTTIDGEQWQRLAFRPEIPLGKFAVALDIELFLNSEGKISDRGWEFGNGTEVANTIFRKIYYVRYGQPGDPVYAKVGSLDDVTLGYGLIMSGYRNTLDYPGVKNLGLAFELHPTSTLAVEGMLNNFLDIKTGGPVVGSRVAKEIVPRVEFGASFVADLDQYGGLADSDGDGYPDAIDRFPGDGSRWGDTDRDGIADPDDRDADGDGRMDIDNFGNGPELSAAEQAQVNAILANAGQDTILWDNDGTTRQKLFDKNTVGADPFGMVGFDAAFKLIDSDGLALITYAQFAMSVDDADGHRANGYGISAPGLKLVMGPLNGRIEYRHIRNEFLPEYFDGLYDHTRAVADYSSGTVIPRDATLDSLEGQTLNGVFGEAGMSFAPVARVSAQYMYLYGDQSQQRLAVSGGLDRNILSYVPKLARVEGFYRKDRIGLYGDSFFEPTIDMIYGYHVGFDMGGGVEIVWSNRWVYEQIGSDPSDVESSKQITFQTVIHF